ncbi:dysbindin-like isoform X1 [Acipenser ruthenus]|uniref:dysbindin-like isoform X1 n=1 Tax=Acipenser ruthenus TaxID=7906 RepID=UPI00156080E4|nr:dysbindin-like isoform X1 [Acipenser ruthenus]
MFDNFREKLLIVQQDFTTGIKTLSDKSKEAKKTLRDKSKEAKIKKRIEDHQPKFPAGVELLNRYEDTWVTLHKRAKESAIAGEAVDEEVVMLSAHWEKRRNGLLDLQEQLQQIPAFLAHLESITSKISHLEADFEEVESHLINLEDLCGQCELQGYKQFQMLQVENYKEKKRKELETLKAELDAEHAQKVFDMENTQQLKLKERQKFFEEAFQQDMEQYLSTGYLQIAERREPIGSMSSMEVNVDMLEQMDLMDMSDQEALDVFLNSGGEDNSVASPMLGPETDAYPTQITLQVPSQAEPRHKLSSLSSTCTDSASQASEAGSDSPIIQSDEEEVQADNTLAIQENVLVKENSDSDT